jgi:hypothetical protein
VVLALEQKVEAPTKLNCPWANFPKEKGRKIKKLLQKYVRIGDFF